ncbi:MAG: ABC transporter ATP-binding protein [Candidatus Saccharimonadales bacterium]
MNTTLKTLKICWQAAWKYPKYVIGLLIMVPVAIITLRLLPALIVADIINRLSTGDFVAGEVWDSFGKDIVLYSVLLLGSGVVAWRILIYLIWKLESYVQRDLYRTMFNKFMELGADFHSNSFGGSLVSQTNKLVGAYTRLQDTFTFQVYTLLISFTFISVVLYPRAPQFVWALWGFSIIFIIFALWLSRRVRKLSAIEAHAQNKVTGYLADAITNIMAIKSFASAKKEQQRFNHVTEQTRHRALDVMWATTKRDIALSTITTSIGILALVAAIIAVVIYGSSIGTVFLLLAYTADMTERLWQLSSTTLRTYNRAIGDAQDAILTLELKPTVKNLPQPNLLEVPSARITFDKMVFAHPESAYDVLFEDFSLDIEPGTKVGLVGRSGSGKTTLTRLLLRFMDIDSGKILIDGQDIAQTTQEDLRKHIAYVPQEPILFHRSLAENIGYGNPTANHAEIEQAAEMAHAHEFIKDLPKTYETLVGERGIKLSGGQRQRIAIARAMIKDAPILLLDEATSALDSESERLIQDALWKLMEGKTAIVIAHRLSTIQKMDRIVVLDKGQIIEQGSHKELVEHGGVYSELWKHQSGGFLED